MTARILSVEQYLSLTDEERKFFLSNGFFAPIAGAAPDGDDDDDDGGGEGENADDLEDEVEGEDPQGESEGDDEHEGEQGGRREPREDEAVVSKSEYERLKRISSEAEKARKKAEREAARRAEQEKRDAGNWEELLRERDERIQELDAEREAARLELETTMRNQRISAVATRLNYRDPMDARHFLSEEETTDEASTERALKRLSREKPYLVETRKSTGAPVSGDGATLTMDEIKRMKPEEVNARWAEVQAAMSANGEGS